MIIGIGTDIVEIDRISASLERQSDRFVARLLTTSEQEIFYSIQDKNRSIAYLAKRFAAKEAAVKALGTGIGRGISFQHFCISNDDLGKPILTVDASIHKVLSENVRWHLSITDERHYAQAFVILESVEIT